MAAYDIFISFKNLDADGKPTRDSVLAGELYEFFTNHGLKVFLSSKSLEQLGTANYKRAIDSALEATQILVAIGTSKENLESKWVEYEWDSFLNEIKSGRKPKGQVFVYTEELGVAELPYALRQNQTFRHGPESLQTLLNFISNALELSPAPSKDSVPQPPKDGTRHPPVSSTDSEKKRYAVVVGISSYEDETIPKLKYAAKDAESFAAVLSELGNFPRDQVILLTEKTATLKNLKVALSDLRKVKPDNLVVFYFAGHGSADIYGAGGTEDDQLTWKYLVPYDADQQYLSETAFSLDDLRQRFSSLSCEQLIVFLDSCYSGAGGRSFPTVGARGVFSDVLLEDIASEGRLVLTASDTNELAFEQDEFGHGLFTYYLLKGMRGEADRQGQGAVTVRQLYQYLTERIPGEAQRLGGRQHPVLKGAGGLDVPLTFLPQSDEPSTTTPPGNVPEPIRRAVAHHEEGNYAEAIRILEAYLPKAGPALGEVYRWIGKNQLDNNNPEAALTAYTAAIGHEPANPAVHAGRGTALLNIGQFDAAIDAFRIVVEIDPSYRDELYKVQHRLEYELNQHPDHPQYLLSLARIRSLQDKPELVLDYLQQAIELWPDESLGTLERDVQRGIVFSALRRSPAYADLKALMERRSALQQTYQVDMARGEAALAAGELNIAQEAFEQCRKLVPGAPLLLERLNELSQQKELCQQYISVARERLATASYEAAQQALEQAWKLDRSNLALAPLKEQLDEVIEKERRTQELVLNARAHEAEGQLDLAAEELRLALALSLPRQDLRETLAALEERIQRKNRDDEVVRARSAALETRLQQANLKSFAESGLLKELVWQWLKTGTKTEGNNLQEALAKGGYMPIDISKAAVLVEQAYKDGLQRAREIRQRIHQHAQQARTWIADGTLPAARQELEKIRSLNPNASELIELLSSLEKEDAYQQQLQILRTMFENKEYETLAQKILVQPEQTRARVEMTRILQAAQFNLKTSQDLSRDLAVATDLAKQGDKADALCLLQCIHLSAKYTQASERLSQQLAALREDLFVEEREMKGGLPEGMALISTGYFVLGTPGDPRNTSTDTRCFAFLEGYAIDQHPVTNGAYREFLEFIESAPDHSFKHPDQPKRKSHRPDGWSNLKPGDDDYPVIGVDWFDAYAFAAWKEKRLPTEAEWEKAGFWDEERQLKRLYPWGDRFDPRNCNHKGSSALGGPAPTGQFAQGNSFYGLADFCGNIWEWCADWYATRYIINALTLSPVKSPAESARSETVLWGRNPRGPRIGDGRVCRGGSWAEGGEVMGASCRSRAYTLHRSKALGFRCALTRSIKLSSNQPEAALSSKRE